MAEEKKILGPPKNGDKRTHNGKEQIFWNGTWKNKKK